MARYWPVVVGVALLSFPTLQFIATESWTTEQGSHGPLVLASGLWLLFRLMPDAKAVRDRPPLFRGVLPVLLATMLVLAFRRAAIIELEVYALYLVYIALLYAFLLEGRWPTPLQGLAAALFTLGILASIKAQR